MSKNVWLMNDLWYISDDFCRKINNKYIELVYVLWIGSFYSVWINYSYWNLLVTWTFWERQPIPIILLSSTLFHLKPSKEYYEPCLHFLCLLLLEAWHPSTAKFRDEVSSLILQINEGTEIRSEMSAQCPTTKSFQQYLVSQRESCTWNMYNIKNMQLYMQESG